jgi:hypothetical protein
MFNRNGFLVQSETDEAGHDYTLGFYQGKRCAPPKSRVVSRTLCQTNVRADQITCDLMARLDPFQRHDHDVYYVIPLIKAFERD